MTKKTDKEFRKMIVWTVILLTLLTGGCASQIQPVSTFPETPKEISESVPSSQKTDQKTPPEPEQEISTPSEAQVIEKVLPEPDVVARITQPPQTVEKTDPPAPEAGEKTISEDFILLNPAVPQDARTIQTRLAELGFYQGPIDGIWGRGSGKALMAFKEKNSLGRSDKWDEEVQMFLFRETSQADQPPLDPTQKLISSGLVLLNPSVPQDTKKIQTRLAELGLYSGAIDGIWGKGSQAGLKSFKKKQSLKNPDKWDKETQLLLFRGTHQ